MIVVETNLTNHHNSNTNNTNGAQIQIKETPSCPGSPCNTLPEATTMYATGGGTQIFVQVSVR